MKICIISNFYPPFFFGGERAVQREAEALARRGHVLVVITSSPNNKSYLEDINGVTIHRISPFNLYPPYEFPNHSVLKKVFFHLLDVWNPMSAKRIRKALQKVRPDVVYVHNFKGLSLTVFKAVKSLGVPFVFSVNDYSLMCPRANLLRSSGKICLNPPFPCRLYARAQRYLLNQNKPNIIISNAQFTLGKFNQNGFFTGIPTKREAVGVNLTTTKANKDYSVFNILYTGGVNKHKGVQVLISAFTELKQPNIRLHIVGRGQDTDEMKRLAGDDQRIIFHGFVSDEKLAELRAMANLAIVPSIWYDMAQGVICESFSYGIPVIGSRIGGIPEFIEKDANGYLFEAGNILELKNIIEKLITNPQELKRLEDGAFESRKKYDIEDHISRLEKMFSELIGQN